MTAATVQPQPLSQSEERRAYEPSMEEILASIRRLIADEEPEPAPRREAPERKAEEPSPRPVPFRREPLKLASDPIPLRPVVRAVEIAPAPQAGSPAVVAEAPAAEPTHQALAAPVQDASELDWLPPLRAAETERPQAAAAEEPVFEAPSEDFDAPNEDEDYYAFAEQSLEIQAEEEADAGEHQAVAETGVPLVSSDAAASIAAQFQTLAASMVINDSGLLHDYAREMLRPMLKAWLDDNLPVLVERLVRAEIERVARGGRRV